MALFVLISALVPAAIVAALLLVVMAFGHRTEPDPTGRRPYLIYLLSMAFVSLALIVVAGTVLVNSLAALGLDNTSLSPGGFDDFGSDLVLDGSRDLDKIATGEAVQTALILAAGFVLYVFHDRRLQEERASGTLEGGAGSRTYSVYLYILCFLTAVTAVIAAAVAAYAVVRVAVPGSVSVGDSDRIRDEALVGLITSGTLTALTGYLFTTHWARITALRVALTGGPAPPSEA